jgi:hypothetical protein
MMTQRKLALIIYWLIAAAAVGFLTLWAARVSQGAISDCIDATCRITAARGSRGSGCVFEIRQGYVYVLTAAHVVGPNSQVQCEFWRFGHQSQPLAGAVIARSEAADVAIVALQESSFGGILPAAIPIAPRDYAAPAGTTITSVGCAQGGWSTGWKGHVLDCQDQDLIFLPPPANGRSGSAIFDAEGKMILAVIRARAADDSEGVATLAAVLYETLSREKDSGFRVQDSVSGNQPLNSIYQVLNPELRTLNPHLVQCPGPGCPSCPDGGVQKVVPGMLDNLIPYRKRQDDINRRQDGRIGNLERVWPTLPQLPGAGAPPGPPADLGPTNEKLDKIAALLTQFIERQEKKEETARPQPPLGDEAAKKAAEEAKAKADAAAEEAKKAAETTMSATAAVKEEVQKETGKLHEILTKLVGDQNTLLDRIEARREKVKEELGPQATEPQIFKAYVKDFLEEKLSDGTLGFSAGKVAAGALGLGGPIAFALGAGLWLVSRRIGTKIEAGEPLLIQKALDRLHERIDKMTGNQPAAATPPPASPPSPQVIVTPVAVPATAAAPNPAATS